MMLNEILKLVQIDCVRRNENPFQSPPPPSLPPESPPSLPLESPEIQSQNEEWFSLSEMFEYPEFPELPESADQ